MELLYEHHTSSWYCECCGGISDETLTVSHNGHVLGTFEDDGHFGSSSIVLPEVEKAVIAGLLVEENKYAAMLAQRETLEALRDSAFESLESHKAGYAYGEKLDKLFEEFLAAMGITVRHNYTSEVEDYEDYDD